MSFSPDHPAATVSRAPDQPAELLASQSYGTVRFVAVFNKPVSDLAANKVRLLPECRPWFLSAARSRLVLARSLGSGCVHCLNLLLR